MELGRRYAGALSSAIVLTQAGCHDERSTNRGLREVPEGYIAFVEELPGANSQGDTLEEARSNLREAVQLYWSQPADCKRSVGRYLGHSRATCADFMKRIDLICHRKRHGAQLLREGGNHSVYVNRKKRQSFCSSTSSRNQRISC